MVFNLGPRQKLHRIISAQTTLHSQHLSFFWSRKHEAAFKSQTLRQNSSITLNSLTQHDKLEVYLSNFIEATHCLLAHTNKPYKKTAFNLVLTFLSIIVLELGKRSENGSKAIEAVLANDPIIIEEE